MATFDFLYSQQRSRGRIAAQSAVGIANTGIDVVNLFREQDEQFKPIDLDEDVFNTQISAVSRSISLLSTPEMGAKAQAALKEFTRAPETAVGEFTEDASVFLLGFLGGRKLLTAGVSSVAKGATTARAGKAAIDLSAGAGSAFVLEDPADTRIANFIPEKHRGAFLNYLAYDPDGDETRLEGRFKNALTDMGLGVVSDTALTAIMKSFKHLRRGVHLEAAGDPEVAARKIAEATGLTASPEVPKGAPEIDLSTSGFEGAPKAPVAPSGAASPAEVVEEILRIGAKDKADAGDTMFRAMNHTHFDYADPKGTMHTADQVLKVVSKELDNQSIQTWDDVLKLSDGVAKKKNLDSIGAIAKLTGETVENLRKATPVTHLIRRMYTESGTELQKLKSSYLQSSPAKQDEIVEELGERMQTHMLLTGSISELGTGAGRLLRSFGMNAQGDLGMFKTPIKDLIDAKKPTPKKTVGSAKDSLQSRVEAALADSDPNAVANAVQVATKDELHSLMKALKDVDMTDAKSWIKRQNRETGKGLKALQVLRKIKMMNILSGLPTLVMNNTGNALSLGFRKGFEDIIAAMVPSRSPDRMRLFGELKSMHVAAQQPVELLGSIFKGTAQAARRGEPLSEVFAKLAVDDVSRLREEHLAVDTLINSNSTGARIINSLGKFAHAMSFGHMELSDMFFKQAAFASETKALANSKGLSRGLKGRDLLDYETTMVEQSIFLARKGKEGARHMLETMQANGKSLEDSVRHMNEVADMVNESRRFAKEGVFQDEISSQTLKAFESALNKQNAGMHMLKTLVFPFYRTPVKIVEFAAERTPILQAFSRKWRADLSGVNGARSQQRAVAKFITGATMYAGAFQLAQNNLITGKHRPEERAALLADGIPEYSIRAPNTDKWISFQRLDPFAMFLGVTADLNKLVEIGALDGGTAAAAVMNAVSSNVLNKTFMKGLADSLEAANNPAQFGAYYTDSQVRAIVSPLSSFQRTFEKVWNNNSEEYRKQKPEPAFTELRDWVDILIGDTGLTDTREYDMSDALGNKIERGPLWSELTGLRATETDDSPAMRELALHKRFPSNRELSLTTGFKMNRKEFLDFKEILGSDVKLKSRLDKIVSTSKYKRSSPDKQALLLDKVIRDARGVAKATLIRRDPELKSKVVAHKRERLLRSLRASEQTSGIPSIDKILETRKQTFERDE